MPVIVVGADTPLGDAVVDALLPRGGEVRAFVSDPGAAHRLKQRGVKVAIGDVSDGSHVGGAALHTFCAVLVGEAVFDDRERSFADSPATVVEAWAEGLADARVRRAIWIGGDDPSTAPAEAAVAEFAAVDPGDRTPADVAIDVARLDAAREIG